jgi:hypothetical protein
MKSSRWLQCRRVPPLTFAVLVALHVEGAGLGATLYPISGSSVVPDLLSSRANHVEVTNMWGEVSMCEYLRHRTIPTVRPPLVGEISVKFADRACHMVSVTDPYGNFSIF